ncbi:glycosyltransferase [Nocardia sp. NBC_01377]|uniref:glycosyltransferase n=1 Tax=Nocardia sp. NBC_01377 TaxID=2903595 RepID=UPI00386503AC
MRVANWRTAGDWAQSAADIIVQRSLQEGFGLTVTEAIMRAKPVLASRGGGISAQIEHDHNGLLLDDPARYQRLYRRSAGP